MLDYNGFSGYHKSRVDSWRIIHGINVNVALMFGSTNKIHKTCYHNNINSWSTSLASLSKKTWSHNIGVQTQYVLHGHNVRYHHPCPSRNGLVHIIILDRHTRHLRTMATGEEGRGPHKGVLAISQKREDAALIRWQFHTG